MPSHKTFSSVDTPIPSWLEQVHALPSSFISCTANSCPVWGLMLFSGLCFWLVIAELTVTPEHSADVLSSAPECKAAMMGLHKRTGVRYKPSSGRLSAFSGEHGLPLAWHFCLLRGDMNSNHCLVTLGPPKVTIERRLEILSWILWWQRFYTNIASFWRKGLKFPLLEVFLVSNLTEIILILSF